MVHARSLRPLVKARAFGMTPVYYEKSQGEPTDLHVDSLTRLGIAPKMKLSNASF
jgi:hypothetical protein